MIRNVVTETLMLCDFCGIDQHKTEKIVAGHNNAAICQECVRICVEILEESVDAAPEATSNFKNYPFEAQSVAQ